VELTTGQDFKNKRDSQPESVLYYDNYIEKNMRERE